MRNLPFLLLLLSGCTGAPAPSENLREDVAALREPAAQTTFLEAIYDRDQLVRTKEKEALQQYGFDSGERQRAIETLMQIDQENLAKVEAYLEIHGHPHKDVHSDKAVSTPWLVIHHAPQSTGARRRLFPELYRAYRQGHLDDITFFLNRMYDMEFGERIIWEGSYRVEEELDTLLRALKLEEVVKRVDKELGKSTE